MNLCPQDLQQATLNNVGCDETNGPSFTLTLTNSDKNIDVWATQEVVEGSKSANNPIVFALKRVMAQVKFKAQSTDAGFVTKITSIKVKTSASASYANKAWGTPTGEDEWTALNSASEIGTTAAEIGTPLNLIPGGQGATITIAVEIYQLGGSTLLGKSTSTITLNNTDYKFWEQGKAYTYNIKVDPTGSVAKVTFDQPTVNEFTPATGEDIPNPSPEP